MSSLKKFSLILLSGLFRGMMWAANSADSRAKRSTNQSNNTYLLIPSYVFSIFFFGKPIDHTITGFAHCSYFVATDLEHKQASRLP
jgi:hypothetical protein